MEKGILHEIKDIKNINSFLKPKGPSLLFNLFLINLQSLLSRLISFKSNLGILLLSNKLYFLVLFLINITKNIIKFNTIKKYHNKIITFEGIFCD